MIRLKGQWKVIEKQSAGDHAFNAAILCKVMEATEGTSDQEHGAAQFSPKQLLELLAEI